MKRVASALALAAFLTSSLAYADEAVFKSADMNGDGTMSAEEFAEAFPSLNDDAFTASDTDEDGAISGEEFAAAAAAGTIPVE